MFLGLAAFLGFGALLQPDNDIAQLIIFMLVSFWFSCLFWDQFEFFGSSRIKYINERSTILNVLVVLALSWYILYYLNAGGLVILLKNSETLRLQLSAGKGEFILLSAAILYVDIYYRRHSRVLTYMIYTVVYFVLIIGVGWRSPGMYFLIWAFLVRMSRIRLDVRVRIKHILFGIILMFFSSFIGLLRAGIPISKFADIMWNMRHLFAVNIKNLEKVVNYTDKTSYRFGWTYLNDLSVAIPGFNSKFTGVYMKEWTQSRFEGETMTITLPGELYLNFGYFGFLVLVFGFPLLVRFTESYLLASKKDISLFIWLTLAIFLVRISTGGIMPIFVFQLVPLLLIYFMSRIRYA